MTRLPISPPQQAARGSTSTVTARKGFCSTPDHCVVAQTFVGVLGSPLTKGNTFTMDPSLSHAEFRGILIEKDTNAVCEYAVQWDSTAEPGYRATHDVDSPGGVAEHIGATTDVSRAARGVIASSDCWGAIFSDGNNGILAANMTGSATAGETGASGTWP